MESDEDLSLLRLDSDLPEITVPLTNGSDTKLLSPAGIAVYPGDATHGACLGVRLANDHDVVTLQFVPNVDAGGKAIGNGFLPTVNLNDVGGVASDIAFVNTDSGLRLAALVPSLKKATLIDPTSSLRTDVALPAPYQNLSVVTNAVGTAGSCDDAAAAPRVATDVALLWNGSSVQGQEGVAFWELGQTGCQSYRSIDTVGVTDVVAGVLDVPTPNDRLKVLQTRDATSFYILNLANRTAAPLRTLTSDISLSISPRGDQVWTYVPNGTTVSTTDLSHQLLPRSLLIERPVSGVYEVTRGTDNPPSSSCTIRGGSGRRCTTRRRWTIRHAASTAAFCWEVRHDPNGCFGGSGPGADVRRRARAGPGGADAKPEWNRAASVRRRKLRPCGCWRPASGLFYIKGAGYDPFSSNDAFVQFSLAGSRALVRRNDLSLAGGIGLDVGGSSAHARGSATDLRLTRVAALIEGRYQPASRVYFFARVAPGLLHGSAEIKTPRPRRARRWRRRSTPSRWMSGQGRRFGWARSPARGLALAGGGRRLRLGARPELGPVAVAGQRQRQGRVAGPGPWRHAADSSAWRSRSVTTEPVAPGLSGAGSTGSCSCATRPAPAPQGAG